MQSLGRPASADRSCGSQRAGPSLAGADPSDTASGLGVKRFFWNQMARAKRAGTWFRLCRRERAMYGLATSKQYTQKFSDKIVGTSVVD